MFKRLNELWYMRGVDISDFWKSSCGINEEWWDIIQILAKEIKWDTDKSEQLITRIRKIGKNDKYFTVRDVKLLRKLINTQKKNGSVDLTKVAYYFPGKTIQTLKLKYNEKYIKGSVHLLP